LPQISWQRNLPRTSKGKEENVERLELLHIA